MKLKSCILVVLLALFNISQESLARTVKRESCDTVLTATSGAFSSPKYPGVYDTELRCSWTIEGSEAVTEISINFDNFDIEWGRNCMFDAVTVKDKAGNLVGGKMCGSSPRQVTVPGNFAVITLTTDDYDGDNTGFSAKYQMKLPEKQGDCNFDKPCSGWTNGPGDVTWKSYVPGQSRDAVLPRKDHSGTGGYKYVHSVEKGQKATLQSSTFSKKQCMRFYYYMDGLFDIGSLRVYSQLTGQNPSELWSLSGNHGSIWKEVDVAFNLEQDYKVLIEAEAGSYSSMDVIAIDDISFVPIEECNTQPACGGELSGATGTFTSESHPYEHYARCTWKIHAPQGTAAVLVYFPYFSLQTNKKENFVTVKGNDGNGKTMHGIYHDGVGVKVLGSEVEIIYHSGYNIQSGRKGFRARYEAIPFISPDDCDFDNGLCNNWVNGDKFTWTIKKSNTPSLFTGPHGDTLTIGQYLYIESSHVSPGTKAHLISPPLAGSKCLSFAYNMHGYEMGTLNVHSSVGRENEKLVWSQNGDHGRKWHIGHVTLEDPGASYNVIFEGITGKSFTSDAALDDITFTNGTCPETKECGGYLNGESGRLQNPGFTGSVDCQWNVVPPKEFSKVTLKLDMSLPETDHCSTHFIQIQDKFGTQIGEKLCGEYLAKVIDIQYGGAKIIYHSDANEENSFGVSYQAAAKRPACGGVIQATTGSFSSPNFPENYPRDQVCEWEITGAPGAKSMHILFENDFAIDDTGVGCAYSYLALYDQNGNEIKRLCGLTKPQPITITGKVFSAQFKSDVYQTAKGFKASFTSYF